MLNLVLLCGNFEIPHKRPNSAVSYETMACGKLWSSTTVLVGGDNEAILHSKKAFLTVTMFVYICCHLSFCFSLA